MTMALNKNQLKNAIKTAMETAKEASWTTEQVAAALADAIDAYVRGGRLKDVRVDLNNGNQIGERPLE
jgi:hypothetical protein